MKITVVGLGVRSGDVTLRGVQAIQSGAKVIVKTALAESAGSVAELGVPYSTLDFVYEKSRSFDSLQKNLVKEVLAAAKEQDVVYCVDGAASEDNSVIALLQKRKSVEIIEGVSKISAAISLTNLKAGAYTAVSAYDISMPEEVCGALVVYDIDSAFLAGDVKLKLCDLLGDEVIATYVRQGKATQIPLYEADRQKEYDYTSVLVVPEVPLLSKERFGMQDLVAIMRLLRKPDGCPWDRSQTNESIKKDMIEEAYELADAIELNDTEKMIEESGDVVLQAVFHAVIREEMGEYNMRDVLSGICKKLISRHTHVFGKDRAADSESALSVWEKNKMQEKHQDTFSASIRDVPKNFPAAMRAQKVQKRAAKAHFDFDGYESAAEKIPEELKELFAAAKEENKEHLFEECGDLLFATVNVVRLCGVDSEESLQASTRKFAERFMQMESLIIADGKDILKLSPSEMDEYYRKAKKLCKPKN